MKARPSPRGNRNQQRALFDAPPANAPRWHDGALIDYLGAPLRLQLDTDRRQAVRDGAVLHLPLPPDASPRQIQDAAEAWLRREAAVLFARVIANEAARIGSEMPSLSLSFSVRGSWVEADHHMLRVNWRLIAQPISIVELTLRRAVAALPVAAATADLFAAFAS